MNPPLSIHPWLSMNPPLSMNLYPSMNQLLSMKQSMRPSMNLSTRLPRHRQRSSDCAQMRTRPRAETIMRRSPAGLAISTWPGKSVLFLP